MAKEIENDKNIFVPPMYLCCGAQLEYKEVGRSTVWDNQIIKIIYAGQCKHCHAKHVFTVFPELK